MIQRQLPVNTARRAKTPADGLVQHAHTFAPEQLAWLEATASASRKSRSTLVREAVELLRAQLDSPITATVVPDEIYLPYLSRVPCGPLSEAIDTGGSFAITQAVADELEARPSDFFVRADGWSMEESGLFDGHLILMRPLAGRDPRRGEPTLVQIVSADGDYEATVKHWAPGSPGSLGPTLTNAAGEVFPVPEGTVRVDAIAVARGVIGRV